MRFRYIIILLMLTLVPGLKTQAQEVQLTKELKDLKTIKTLEFTAPEIPDEILDTMTISKKTFINDYSLIGLQYGVGLSQVMWNPSQKQDMVIMPYNIGVTYTRYGKMFGYMPHFGFQVGLFYGQEGYKFKKNEEAGYIYTIQGADKAVIDMIEMPVLSHMHIDFWKMKVMVDIGFYAGYRLKIHRFPVGGEYKNEAYAAVQNQFLETDRRWDYGIKGGLGFGFIFDPIEVHLKAAYKHSLSSLYDPDYNSPYYYRYAYPSNIIISAGVHFQLTKRTGKTKAELRKEAKELVYGTDNSVNQR